jgi:ADP-ribose pyrophosphatase
MNDPVYQSSEAIFSSQRFSLAKETFRAGELIIERPVIHHPGAVAVLAQPTVDSILLVRQYRYPLQRWSLEVPAGTIDPAEDPITTAKRELSEEAGYAAAGWSELLRFYPAVGLSDEEMVLFAAAELSPAPGTPDEGELVQAEIVALKDLPALFHQGLICDAKTIMAVGMILGGRWWQGEGVPC